VIIFKKRDCAYVVKENEIYTCDAMYGIVDYESEGKLISITIDDVRELEELLKINSIEEYGVEILDDEYIIEEYLDPSLIPIRTSVHQALKIDINKSS